MRSIRALVVGAIALGASGSAALAGLPPTDMNMFISQQGGISWNWQGAAQPGAWTQDTTNPDLWHHSGAVSPGPFTVAWDLDLDPDPLVTNNFSLTNNTGTTQTYTLTVVLPVPAIAAPTITYGSVSGTLGDTNGDASATLSTLPGSAIYTALIDGGVYQQLLPDVFSVSTPPVSGGTTPFPFGINFFSFPGGQPGVATSIAITNHFSLSAGDSVTMVSTFRIDPVPAPGAAALLALGGLAAARRRRA